MENASKALIIAGAILLSILIIGLGMYIYQQAAGVMEGVNMDSQEVQAYNSQFLNYEGQRNGTQVKALCDLVRNHNNSNADDSSLQIAVFYAQGVSGKQGKEKTEDNISDEVTYQEVTDIRNSLKAGKLYNVSFTPAKSGKIISVKIEDKTTKTTN